MKCFGASPLRILAGGATTMFISEGVLSQGGPLCGGPEQMPMLFIGMRLPKGCLSRSDHFVAAEG